MRGSRQKGQSVVELAMLLPLLMLILLGSIDLGRVFSAWMALANGSREGAHYACRYPLDIGAISTETKLDIAAEGLSADLVVVNVQTPEGPDPGKPIAVTATYPMQLLTSYLFGGQPVTIKARTQMVIIAQGISS